MKKRSLIALCLIALVGIVVFVSCMQDPILDNKALGKWTAENNLEDKITLDVLVDQTFTMTLKQDLSGPQVFASVLESAEDSIEITVTGTWDASSVTEGTMHIKETGADLSFTASDTELILTNSEQHVSIRFSPSN